MRKVTLTTTIAVVLLLLSAGPAMAHAGLMPGDLAPGTTIESEVVIVHGCGPDGTIPANDAETSPTTAVTLTQPEGLTIIPRETAGWTLTAETDATGDLRRARWESTDPGGTLEAVFLGVEVTADADLDGAAIYVPVVQDCVDGEQLAWVAENPHETGDALPAMLVNVDAAVMAASAPPSTGVPTSVIVTLAVALGIVVGGGVVIVSARRG